MKGDDLIDELIRRRVVQEGHYVLANGGHSDTYVNKDGIYPDPEFVAMLCSKMAYIFGYQRARGVVGPEKGGIILSQWTAYSLITQWGGPGDIFSVYAEKSDDGSFVFNRGYDKLVAGKSVLIVEDILTTGGSVAKVIKTAQDLGATIVGVAAIWNRNPDKVTADSLGVPKLKCLVEKAVPSWPMEECELCARGIPINTDVGHGKQFLAEHPNYPVS